MYVKPLGFSFRLKPQPTLREKIGRQWRLLYVNLQVVFVLYNFFADYAFLAIYCRRRLHLRRVSPTRFVMEISLFFDRFGIFFSFFLILFGFKLNNFDVCFISFAYLTVESNG